MQLNLIKAHQGQRVTLNGFKDFAVLFETNVMVHITSNLTKYFPSMPV